MIKSLILLSNYFNHHQKPLSDALFERLGGGYIFIETEPMDDERKKMGWVIENTPSYVVSFEDFEDQREYYLHLIRDADVVLIGSAPNALIEERIKLDKLVFRYAERPLRKGIELWKYPFRYLKWHRQNPKNKCIYMLCASAYTAGDYAKFGLFKDKCFKWGYFPPTKQYSIETLLQKKKPASILWVARFIPLKHPELAIEMARDLKSEGYEFKLQMIGEGILHEEIQHMVKNEGLQDNVELLNFMKPEAVREYMEESVIFLFTSDQNEGWGAVVNEAMNSGCTVVASHAIGSVPFLMKEQKNGLIYESENVDMLFEKVKFLLDHPEEQERLGKNAYSTITDEWNAEEAANRLVNLAEHILSGEKNPDLYMSGPCSRAEILKDNWCIK